MSSAQLRIDQEVDVHEEGGRLVIEPVVSPSYDLESLVAGITDENLHDEITTGSRVGNEFW